MKQILLFFALISFLSGWATEPVGTSGNIKPGTIDGNQVDFTFDKGGGSNRIIVMKEGAQVVGTPSDGVVYGGSTVSYDAKFEQPGTEFTAAGEYVVYKGTATSITVKNLKPATTYYIAIFEYNTSGTPNPDYLLATPVASITTASAPTVQGTIAVSTIAGSSVKLTYTNGNGARRIIVGRKGTSITASPTDLQSYGTYASGSTYLFGANSGKSNLIDAETFVVYKVGSGTVGGTGSFDLYQLEPNTTYTFAVFEYNGPSYPVYLKTIVATSFTTTAGPTIGTKSVGTGSVEGNSMTVNWSKGNGAKQLVIAKKGSAVTTVPVNGITYTANAVFGTPEAEIAAGSGEFVVYSGESFQVNVTSLEMLTTYHFAVYEYDVDANGYTYYLTAPQSSTLPARKSQSTLLPPTGNTTIKVVSITGTTAKLEYVYPPAGRGDYRLLVIRDGDPVEFAPEDLKTYSSAYDYKFGNGQLVGPNTYTIIWGSNGGAPTITGLTPGHTYHLAVFDHNGRTAPMYLRPGATAVITIPDEPTAGSTMRTNSFSSIEGNAFRFDWNIGNGSRRVVVARKGAAVTQKPQDGTSYTASAKFGEPASEIAPGSGEFVVYDGSSNSVTLTGLEKATTYHLAVFEYNVSSSGPDYLTADSKFLVTSQATVSAPTIQVSELGTTGVLSDRATITFKVGNGTSRIFVMREGGVVDAEPSEFIAYSENSFGNGSQIGTGNFVVGKAKTSSFTVTGLKAGTQYFITAYEFNGSSGPVYLRPGADAYSFTTTGAVVIAAPASTSHTPKFENVDGNKFTFTWEKGDGASRIVVARKGSAVSFTPIDGVEYAAKAAFGDGADVGDGQYVVYKGSGNTVDLTKLDPSATYHFAVYEYNGATTNTKYLTRTFLATSQSTAIAPASPATLSGTSFTSTSITFNWNKGDAYGNLIIVKEDGEVTAAPANLATFNPNADIRSAPQLAAGEYIVYAGTGSSVTITGITAGKVYHFAVFAYNGSSAPVYNTTTFLKATVVPTPLPVNWVSFTGTVINGKAHLSWVTAREVDNIGFEVERSRDGVSFDKVGALLPNTTFVYQFTDQQPLEGTVYYRIKQLDGDGQFSYSRTIKLSGQHAKAVIRLLQNPVQGQLKLQCSPQLLGGKLYIVSTDGRILLTYGIAAEVQSMEVQKLQKGMYYLQVLNREGERQTVLPFIKN